MVRFSFTRKFVGGTLEGLTHTDTVEYPESSADRVAEEFRRDMASRRVIRGFGSPFIITEFKADA